jgi:TRAP-type C4-dicarboxylate transport system permease small subunit
MAGLFFRFEQLLTRWTLRAAMALLVLCSIVSFYQVVTRFVLEDPSAWSEVTARALNIWMVYLGVAVAFRTGALIAVDYLVDRLHGRARAVLVAVIAGVSLGVLGVMLWFGTVMVMRAQSQMLAGVLNPFTGEGVSISLVYAAIPAGAALAIVGLIARTVELLREAAAEAEPIAARRQIFEV